MLIKTLVKESGDGSYRAEIHQVNGTDYKIEYYGPTGSIKSEPFKNSSIFYVENAAANWINSIRVLNG